MIALAGQCSEEGQRGFIGWILLASIALHVLVFVGLPSAPRIASAPPPSPVVVEMAEPPPAPPPPPPVETPSPAPEPALARPALAAPAPARAQTPRTAAPETTPPTSDAPMDFTSTVFSNDGSGLAIGGSSRPAPFVAAQGTSAAPTPVIAPRVVPLASLARKPRAPGLDAELERQYPPEARRSGISGTAVLRVRILPDGRIGEIRVMSESWTGFGPACERTVRAARWEPPIDQDGTPVSTEITYTCRFEVRSG